MKKLTFILLIGVVALGTSCKKYLDINSNPNSATTETPPTPQLILPQALVATASNLNGFNSYGAQLGGFMANAGGYGGFGTAFTYNFSANDNSARWSSTYDNLEDYQAILDVTEGKPELDYFNAVARIMKAHSFQLLVDTYNDVPYSEALKGVENLTPAYDKAEVIYKDLADELDKAIATIVEGDASVSTVPLGSSDIVFGGDVALWKQFANTLKLKILLFGNGKVTFSNASFTGDGFLSKDALINPGFTRDNGRQNPKWNTWGFSYTGSDGNKAWMPTIYVFTFYNGTKLNDPGRGKALYYLFPSGTGTNQLGFEDNSLISSPSGSFWYPSSSRTGTSAGNATGALKGPEAGYPLMTAAESYFLQAEGSVRGIGDLGSADAAVLFNNGIGASFSYLYTKPTGTVTGDPSTDATAYIADNSASRLVNFSLATSTEQKIEAIITQKYIAMNMVNSEVGWNDYRRTHYPSVSTVAGASGIESFASLKSESSQPDRLPTRILYPTAEGSYNSTNVPKGITPFTSKVFWAL